MSADITQAAYVTGADRFVVVAGCLYLVTGPLWETLSQSIMESLRQPWETFHVVRPESEEPGDYSALVSCFDNWRPSMLVTDTNVEVLGFEYLGRE